VAAGAAKSLASVGWFKDQASAESAVFEKRGVAGCKLNAICWPNR
jgi:hypothetical protein